MMELLQLKRNHKMILKTFIMADLTITKKLKRNSWIIFRVKRRNLRVMNMISMISFQMTVTIQDYERKIKKMKNDFKWRIHKNLDNLKWDNPEPIAVMVLVTTTHWNLKSNIQMNQTEKLKNSLRPKAKNKTKFKKVNPNMNQTKRTFTRSWPSMPTVTNNMAIPSNTKKRKKDTFYPETSACHPQSTRTYSNIKKQELSGYIIFGIRKKAVCSEMIWVLERLCKLQYM